MSRRGRGPSSPRPRGGRGGLPRAAFFWIAPRGGWGWGGGGARRPPPAAAARRRAGQEAMTRQLRRIVQMQTIAGRHVTAGQRTIIPLARVATVRLPRGGFVWNRPLAVLVLEDGRVTRIPIRDATRLVQL